ncbi:hypothetical protein D3C72_2240460 [compost metagenome]
MIILQHPAVDAQQTAATAFGRRMLGNQVFGQVVIEIGNKHDRHLQGNRRIIPFERVCRTAFRRRHHLPQIKSSPATRRQAAVSREPALGFLLQTSTIFRYRKKQTRV